ncbi:MAG: hypothetical protein K2I23_07065 [Clostridia bacterium]|nr:hypothetical protein [Clostridia bacterium]
MRKRINVIVCIIIVVCVAAFAVACQPKDADGLIKLSSPSNLALNGSTLSWDEVKNAQIYYISVDGTENENGVSSTTCDLSAMVTGYGNFSITVRAYGDGKKYGTSDNSQPIVYHKGKELVTPAVTIADKVASWSAIDNAVSYSVKVTDAKGNMLDEFTGDALSYNFADKKTPVSEGSQEAKDLYGDYGAYRISVIANPASDNIEYSPSLAGIATYYNSTVLSVPKFTDITSSKLIRWGAVANATNYTLRKTYEVDGTYEETDVTGTSCYYNNKFNFDKVGKYTFTIRANGDNQVYYTSAYSEADDEFVVNKLASVDSQDIELKYVDGKANLSWKLPADSLATEFILGLTAPLPNGEVKLERDILQQKISNKIKFVEGNAYRFFKYKEDGESIEIDENKTILLYNMDGTAKVRYDGKDYFLKDKDGKDVTWRNYTPSASVDIICDMSDPDNIKFVNERKQYNTESGAILSQLTDEKPQPILDSENKQLFYFEKVDGETEVEVVKDVEYDSEGKVIYHTFKIVLDDIFIKETNEDGKIQYDYSKKDNYYGLLYDVSISADNDSKNFFESQSVTTAGQYMSYKIPQKESGRFIVTNAGEYAYIILNSFINEGNTDTFYVDNNINFNGYELAQIETFSGVIDGNKHTVSGIVIGNKVMTQNGVVKSDNASLLNYSMFVNIDNKDDTNNGIIENIFYVGMGFVGYDKEKLEESVSEIKVAPIAINNKGTIRNVLVQSDSIKAEGAQVAGMVIDNNGYIVSVSVYANLEGTTVGGVMINNTAETFVTHAGFYGDVKATLSDILTEGVTSIGGAGLAVYNNGNIVDSFSIGDVSVSATGLDKVYAGGFVAVNNGTILESYSGEFTLNNVFTNVTANGDHAYAGGFVGLNSGNIQSSYSTNKTTASLYAGGFVGYNESTITSCYSTGGTTRTGENRGAFVGKNVGEGNIAKSVAYSTDSWANDSAVTVFTSSEKLDDIISVLYGEDESAMTLMRDKGYRNPLIKGLIYIVREGNEIKNIVTIRPSQTVDAQGVVFNGEVKDVESTMHGDNTIKGNKIVIELSSEGVSSRYIYGYVK